MDKNRIRQGLDWSGISRRLVQVLGALLFQGVILFLSAGRINWLWGWVLIGVYVLSIAVNAVFTMRYNPDIVAERGRATGMRGWDKVVGGLWGIFYYIVTMLVAGLDERWGWTSWFPLAWHIVGLVIFVLGLALFSWAMISNAYFSTVVRIQTDRGHTVYTGGPYRVVRHPGYVGAILQSPAAALLLGSWWALIPGALAALLMVVRTALEDRTLQQELVGYTDYARQVRYRLIPGIW